ncbi:MAG TPA: PH domain-containing protein [Anaerolineales bacterium]|nr:PH domain-containing protein [Anaerolineales bacterium]
MDNTRVGHFPPAKQYGLILHVMIIIMLAGASMWGFGNLTNARVGPTFVTYLLVGILAFAPIPFLGYRAFALFKADYYIDRDSLAILWGLRIEDIPLTDIEWVRPASDLTHPLALPRFRLPGAVLGTRRHPDLGAVEFIASSARNLILVATSKHVFAISPRDAVSLVRTFARATELGSLTPTEAKSVYPSFVITQAWESPVARFLWLTGLLLNLGLVAWVGFLIPALSQVPFGFDAFGVPNVIVPSSQLILLPLISGLMFITGFLAGLYLYRWDKERPLAFIIWVSSTLCTLLFLLAVLFLVTPLV